MLRPRTLVRSTLFAGLCIPLFGCPLSKTPTEAVVSKIETVTVVQGNGQTAQAGRLLATPIILRVVDANGKGVAKQVATFVVVAGGGAVDAGTVVSDTTGEMRVKWTLGASGAAQTLMATLAGTVSVTVGATALFPATIIVAQGVGQTAKIVTVLKNDVVVRVVGPNNTPMIGIPVTFTVTAGGGGLSPQSGVTNALGELSTKWTLGSAAGSNTISVSSGSLPSITVGATATP